MKADKNQFRRMLKIIITARLYVWAAVICFLSACAASTDWNNPCDQEGSNYSLIECMKKQQDSGSQCEWCGRILNDNNGDPLPGATITLGSADTRVNGLEDVVANTDGTGCVDFSFDTSGVVYSVTVTMSGYQSYNSGLQTWGCNPGEKEIRLTASSVGTPAAPSGLTIYPVSSSQVDLTWADNSDNELGFKIERKTEASGTYSTITETGPDVVSYSDTGLSPGTAYYYRVYAYNSTGDSGYSDEISVTTPAGNAPPAETASIPAGCFNMGDAFNEGNPDELPVHNVCLSAFRMDVYEVTNARYKGCVDAGYCSAPGNSSSSTRSSYYGNSTYDNYPVLNVSWTQAQAFCVWAGGRLPTEAEWEYADRGGLSGQRYPWGNDDPTCTLGATNGAQGVSCSPDDTIQVGSFSANGYGLYDMAGNAWEWVNDWQDGSYYSTSPTQDPQGPSSGSNRGVRGGGWGGADSFQLRVAYRNSDPPSYFSYDNGFRCVNSASSSAAIPSAPSGLTAVVVQDTEITLLWKDNSDNETGFTVWRKTGAGGYTLITTTGPDVVSIVDHLLSPQTAYFYHVFAVNGAGSSTEYTEASATTLPLGVSASMASIPAGCFNMGDAFGEGRANESPVHNVCLSTFKMNVYEVTNAQYKACVDAASCTAPGDSSSNTRSSYYGNATYDNYPVIYVDWDQSKSFCQWTGGRLPTEAEWEYAARGGLSGKRYPWGDNDPTCTLGANNGVQNGMCSPQDTIAVGSFAPNGYGLYDMAGNVWEWVNDWYSDTYYSSSPTQDPQGPSSGSVRVLRGGCWGITDPFNIRASVRGSNVQTYEWKYYGFRCVR